MTPLDFAAKRDGGSDSWRRADPTAALIERVAYNRFLVTLPDSKATHEVQLERDHGAFTGDCRHPEEGVDYADQERCPARKYNDGSDDGTTIEVFERDDVEIGVILVGNEVNRHQLAGL